MRRRTFLGGFAGLAALAAVGRGAFGQPLSAAAATYSVDFNDYPIVFDHLNWQLQTVHTLSGSTVTGFTYGSGTGAGQRTNRHGVTWPTTSYYDTVLGAGGYAAVNSWTMKAMTLYATEKPGGWQANGWNHYQDLAEGATCVDDSARTVVALVTDYLLNGTTSSYTTARELLTFICYMTTMEGKVYNFAWLDAPAMFAWDPMQSQNKHYMFRCEFVRRTQYPPVGPGGSKASWSDFLTDPSHIITSGGSPVRADPFIDHPAYSIAMDDLVSTGGADVAPVYNGPVYSSATGAPSGYVTGIKKDWTTSTHNLGGDDARMLWALGMGIQMMQKRATVSGGLTADETFFAKFLENHLNRVLRNVTQYDLGTLDNRLASMFLIGYVEVFRALYVGGGWGVYTPLLPQTGGSAGGSTSGLDDPVPQSTIYSKIDEGINRVVSKQYRTSDWRNGIFIDDAVAGEWQAWGQHQIYALSKAYRLKRDMGQPANALDGMLDIITYSADTFYGDQAYHYKDSTGNYVRTKERIPSISGWAARFHTNAQQSVYQDAPMVGGLLELAGAWEQSTRADKVTRAADYRRFAKIVATWFLGNNSALLPMYTGKTGTGAFEGRGAVLDSIELSGSTPYRKGDAGGESTAEGLWAMIIIKHAIATYGLGSTFSFDG